MNKLFSTLIVIVSLIVIPSCAPTTQEGESANCIYFWKGFPDLTDNELTFLADNDVSRVYLRFFDIRNDFRDGPVPDAEVGTYRSDFPDGIEIVPCVFITLEAIEGMEGREREFARKIYDRIDAKCQDGDITFNEIQLDCDWTEGTRATFFNLCKELRRLTAANNQKLSSTIRLHQLSQPNPDVDRGVLMVYNVGELKNHREMNSILRSDIVKRYLENAPAYKLPIDVAFPVFSWGVVFNGTDFQYLTRIDGDPDTIPELRRLHDNVYVLHSNLSGDVKMDYSQTVRYEMATFEELKRAKQLVEDYLGYKPENTILYHLDEKQLSKYQPEQIKQIYE